MQYIPFRAEYGPKSVKWKLDFLLIGILSALIQQKWFQMDPFVEVVL